MTKEISVQKMPLAGLIRRAAIWLVSLTFFVSPAAFAQVLYGTLLGNVAGPDHAYISGAKVLVKNPATGLQREESTDNSGAFAFHDLQPGTYALSVEAPGFAIANVSGIEVTGNVITRSSVTLAIATASQSVEVLSSNSVLQTDSGDRHSEISSEEIENLPLNGYRNYQTLLNLVPGATPARYQNSVMDTPSRSLTTNINGSSRNAISTAVDGAAIQQVYLPHHTLYNPPADAIESVNVTTNSFTAEQGLAGGAVVTVITKSGTNNFHGTAFEDHTNSAMAARNFFYLGSSVPKNLLNQFGGTLGGPIRKNKLFFFTSYEGLFQRQNYSTITTVPTAAERAGNFAGLATIYDPSTGASNGTGRSAFLNNVVPASMISTAAQKMLSLVPLPNLGGTSNNYFVGATYSLDRHSLDEKGTWQIDSKSSMFAKFSYMNALVESASTLGAGGGTGLSPGGGSAGSGVSHTNVYVVGVGYSSILTPSLLLDANFGFGRNDLHWVEYDYGKNYGTDFLGIPGTNGADPLQSGLPSFAISGFETFGNTDAYTPEIKHDDVFTYVGNLAWTKGRHSTRFGVQALNNRLNEFQPQRGFGPRGGFTFTGGSTSLNGGKSPSSANAFADFLLGDAATLGKSYQYENPIDETEWQLGIYAQDQWLVTPRLTFTYGVRWEYYPILHSINRYDSTTNQVYLGGFGSVPSNAGTTANPHQFAPRAGLAYRLNDKTVFRAGYGISIDPYPFSRAMRDPYPVTIAQTITSPSSYTPAGTLAAGIPAVASINSSTGVIPLPLDAYTKTLNPGEFTRGYVESFNVAIERSLPAGLDLTTAYVGTRSIHQMAYIEENAGQIPGAGSAGQPLYIAFGRAAQTQLIKPYNTANYNSLQVNLKRRFSHGFLLTASYTYSKSIDFSTDSDSVPLFNAVAYQYRNRAVSDFDRTHVFQSGFVAELPFGARHHWLSRGVAGALAGGWQINGLASRFSGLPFTPTASATSLNAPFNTQVADQINPVVATFGKVGTNATWFDTSAYAAVSQPRFGTAGRNSLRGPGASDFDLSITRSFLLREWLKFDLRGEAFNLTNTPAFANPANSVSSGTFGHITATVGGAADSRVLRVSGKFTF
jgi:outer membrane receptor protein involved in Fe transport